MIQFYFERKFISLRSLIGNAQFAARTIILSFVLFALPFSNAHSQLVVTQNANAQSLAQVLSGSGVTISNYSKTCDNNGTATFTSTGTNLGISQGIILASGKVQDAAQPATNFAASVFPLAPYSNDPQLSTLTSGNIYDKCILEFDIVPQGSTLKFDYVFASEEYPEFVCSPYNDVFGFFITGPNPSGGNYSNKNLATLPNSTTPVCINSVNPGVIGSYPGSNWDPHDCVSLTDTVYYIDNLNPVNPNIVYDGMTTVLTATASVIPCQTYHLKIAVADVGDQIYDSGVFLQAHSFTSPSYSTSVTAAVNSGYSNTYEGCVGGSFTVAISSAQTTDVNVNLTITGTATPGADYTTLPSSVIIPAGQTSVTLPFTALADNITEIPETVIVSIVNGCSGAALSSDSLIIKDVPIPTITVGDTTLCYGQSTQLGATGATTYVWSPSTGLNNANIANPLATPTTTTTYTVNMTLGTCVKAMSASKIVVSQPAVTIASSPNDTICILGGTIQLTATASNGIPAYSYVWNNTTVGNVNTAIGTGIYSVTATDAFGCTVNTSRRIIISNMSLTGTPAPVVCFGNTNGAINITPTGLNSPFTYNWNDGPTSQNRTALTGGIYTVTVTNKVGCSATASYTVSQPTAPLSATANASAALCNAAGNGSVSVTANGGLSPYHYLWNTTDTLQSVTNLAAATYTVTVTDLGGCTITKSATVTQPAAITISETHTAENCFGGNNAGINVSATGGAGSYSFAWNNSMSGANITSLMAGTYTVTASDINNCSAVKSITITEPTAVSAATAGINPQCNGLANGSVNVTVSGGTPGYTYLWNGGATSQNISALASGTYSVVVTDSKNCTASASATLSQSGNMVPAVTSANVKCFGGNDGAITLSVTGGTLPYSYNWGGGVTSQNRTSLVAGNYNVVVKDSNLCTVTAAVTIQQPAQALSVNGTSTNVLCNEGSTGTITITTTGGTQPYTYNWGAGIITQNRTNIPAGNYAVVVIDSNSCTANFAIAITEPANALNASAVPTNILCFNANTGSITLTATGGTTPYTYDWGAGVTSQNRSNLIAGTYPVTVTDKNLCSVTASATVTQPSQGLTANASATNVLCFGGNTGSITVTASGGSSNYTYNWGGGITTQNRTNLIAGNYSVTVSDGGNCSALATATVGQPLTAINISATPSNVSCTGGNTGAITVAVSGGTVPYTFDWGGGVNSQNRNNLIAGIYQVTVTDNNLCSATSTATVTQPVAALTLSPSPSPVACFGGNTGNITLTVNGGTTPYSYNWGNGITSKDRNSIASGAYQVTVTDSKSCTATATANVTQPVAALKGTATVNHVSCNGGNNGAATINASGGTIPYSYDWGNNIKTSLRSNLAAGSYVVTITDTKGCTALTSVTINQPATLTLSASPTPVSCFGGSNGQLNLSIQGGIVPYSYKWSTGASSQNLPNLGAGNYSVVIADSNNCSVSATFSISQPAQLKLSATSYNAKCFGDTTGHIDLSIAGGVSGYNYLWNNNSTGKNLVNVKAGSYSATVTDANTCTATISKTISEPAAITLSETHTNVSCFGTASANINANASGGAGGFIFNWNNSATGKSLTGLSAGVYTLTVTDSGLCTAVKSVTITEPAAIKLFESHTAPLCKDGSNGSISVTVTGGNPQFAYSWSNGDTTKTINSLRSGSYSLTVTDASGCSATMNPVEITDPEALSLTLTSTDIACYGNNTGKIDAAVSGGTTPYTFMWSDNSTGRNLTGIAPGNYWAKITDKNGCTRVATAVINTTPAMQAITATNPLACEEAFGDITLDVTSGNPPYTYKWTNGAGTKDILHVHPGTYSVTVTDSKGCELDKTITIISLNTFSIKASGGGTIKLGEKLELVAVATGSQQTTYNWTPGKYLSCSECTKTTAQPLESTLYTVVAVDTNGCTAQDTVSIDVIDDHTIFIPNAFTPNGNGNNDFFRMFGNFDAIRKAEVSIYDRWGEKVFESTEATFAWNGTYKGEPAPPGVYVYLVNLEHIDGQQKLHKGSVTLLR